MTEIISGRDISDDIKYAIADCKMTVTDTNVNALYPQLTDGAFVIDAGEQSKSGSVLFSVIEEMSRRGLKRGDRIAAVGGGVVGDVTGLAAALYMRGIEWISVPTTLLAMVDSGLGGKTAINHCGIKNLVGAFHEPIAEYISAAFIDTLSEDDILCGYGEIIKTCLLTADSFNILLSCLDGMKRQDGDILYALIIACVGIKKAVVAADPTEHDLRKVLNVGHTVGHALESLDGFKCGHGEYVMKGIMTECAMFKDFIDADYYARLNAVLGEFTSPPRTTAKSVCAYATRDKKNVGERISVMLPTSRGVITEVQVTAGEFTERYTRVLRELRKA